MKVTSVEIHPSGSSEIIELSFRDPRLINSFNVIGIAGLDADEIVPRFYGVSGANKYYSLSLVKRDIAVAIELNPSFEGETYSDLRDQIYRMISSSRTGFVDVKFKNGTTVVAVLSGFVSKVENDLFSEETPTVTVTIAMTEPILKAPTRTDLDILTLDPASTHILDEMSTMPHGFIFEIGFLTPQANLIITPPDDAWVFAIAPVGGFLSGDIVHFSSELNNKYLYVRRSGVDIQLADAIGSNPIWPIIFPGDNVFEFNNPTNLVWEAVSFYSTYWGV